MLRKNKWFYVIGLIFILILISWFGMQSIESSFYKKEDIHPEEKYRIGVSYENLENEYVKELQKAIRQKAEELHVTIIEEDGRGKAENQVTQVENFIFDEVDAIILNPYEKDGTVLAVKKAKEAKIPLIVLSGEVENLDEATAYVGSNDIVAGRMETELIVNEMGGEGNVVILHMQGGSSVQISRDEGIKNVLSQYPDIHIIAEQTANGIREQAKYVMGKWLKTLPEDVNAVIAQNDAMALGASDAIKEARIKKEIHVVGIDAISDSVKAVKDGRMLGTIFQDSEKQGYMAVELALKAAQGDEIDHVNYSPFRIITQKSYIK